MKLFAPQNIFTSILETILPPDVAVSYKPSSLVVKELEKITDAVALIPSLDLIKHKELLVSGKLGISFDGLLSQSYFYFNEGQKSFENIYLRGDVSLNELLLTKILFQERYSSQVELILDTSSTTEKGRNYIICGDDNFSVSGYEKGISLADEISDMMELPFVNYVFASPDREVLKQFENCIDKADQQIEDTIENTVANMKLTPEARTFITANIGSVYYDMLENEQDALKELIRLMFYHGIINDIFDIKFI